jgi:Ca2+-binding EF-hand superfamily protein
MTKAIFILFISALTMVTACKNEYSNLPDTGTTLDTFDLNRNGLYETNELTLVCNATPKGPTLITQDQLTKADKNKDGYITIGELEVLFYSSPPGWIPCK